MPADREATTRRIVLGTVAGVVCLLRGGRLAARVRPRRRRRIADRRRRARRRPSCSSSSRRQPQGVTVVPAAEPGTVVVAWQAVGEAGDGIRYQVRPQTDDAPPQNTDQLSLTFQGVAAGARPCYTVVAITADGRTSDESTLVLPLTASDPSTSATRVPPAGMPRRRHSDQEAGRT